MTISPSKAARAALAAVLLASVAVPALSYGQQGGQDKPESLLPPGFDAPPTPAPAPAPAPAATRAPDSTPQGPDAMVPASEGNDSAPEATPTAGPVDYSRYDMSETSRHSLARVGATAWGNPPFSARAFGRSDGKLLSALMRRVDAPVASRWVSIALRRALLSRIDTPVRVNGADFAAERAWLLIRMGEATAARLVVQDVDAENYTPKLFQIAMQVSLANADPGGICPIAEGGAKALANRAWPLARAMCAGLAGEPQRAGKLFDAARGSAPPGDLDTLLAEKVLGAGAQARRAVTIEWQGVAQLSAWRWGLAIATGEAVPEALYATAGPQVRYWRALSPAVAPADRVQSAELAAAQGVFSSAGLADLYGLVEEQGEGSSAEVAAARDLRAAFTAATQEDRVKSIKTLWAEPTSARGQYARLVLTARAAAGIVPSRDRAADADRLVASMLSAGMDKQALEWRGIVARGSDGWALIALADPAPDARVATADFDAYRSAASTRKAQLALAGLAGLGRLDSADVRRAGAALQVDVAGANRWTRAIDAAARRGEAGTVALLAAVGMQTRSWERVSPEALLHIVAGFRAVGMANYARMIAVEAITRS